MVGMVMEGLIVVEMAMEGLTCDWDGYGRVNM